MGVRNPGLGLGLRIQGSLGLRALKGTSSLDTSKKLEFSRYPVFQRIPNELSSKLLEGVTQGTI